MAFLAPALMIAGTVFSGVSALGQGLYQSQVAKNNAVIAERNANLASQAAQTQALRSDREYAAQRGMVLAQGSASGTLGASRDAVLGLVDRNRAEASMDIRTRGGYESEGFNNQAAGFKGQANAAKSAGISSLIGSVFDAGSMALGGTKGKSRAYPWSK